MAKQVEICIEIKRKTPKAYLVSDGGDDEQWLPRSQMENDEDYDIGDTFTVSIPEWLAKEKGFI
jgi:predicted RNA-binding protein (virulence factor B family)